MPRAYAGIVVDAKSGKVLYESDADEYRYPASVIKVMTLYILFQDLEAGKIKLSDKRAALDSLAKHLGMFVEKVEHTGKNGGALEIQVVRFTDAPPAKE